MDSGQVVTARGVTKSYGSNRVLTGVDVDITQGVTGLLGSNGAGKTTFIGLVLGLHRCNEGSLSVLGRDPWTAGRTVRAHVGFAPEHHQLPPDLPAVDFVRHMAEVHGIPRRAATGRASDALFLVGLGEERTRALGTMSTGQRQRVKLAQAIAHDPDLIILDEPTDGLDPSQRDEILRLIARIHSERGMAVLLSSHLLHEVEQVCTHVVAIEGGRVARAGPIDELRGEGNGMLLDLDEPDERVEALAQHLAQKGVQVTRDLRRLKVEHTGSSDELRRYVRDAVAEGGFALHSLANRTITLADVIVADAEEAR